MCSIAGFTGSDRDLVVKMNRAMAHRGPDGTGVFVNDHVSLGHNLLAIVDVPSDSAQPMISEDGRFVLVYNGEVYNYRSLRDELVAAGDRFKTKSDTEVVLTGLVRYGSKFLARLDGMFALALYDTRERILMIARDPAGQKPLYYARIGNRFVFASELRGLFAHPIRRDLNEAMLSVFMTLGYVPGDQTLVRGVSKLCPGQLLTVMIDTGDTRTEWFGFGRASRDESVSESFDPLRFRNLMGAAVEAHTMGLRPFGLYLSGGLDSTIILHELATRRAEMVRTYTTRFDTPNGLFNEDADYAQRLTSQYQIDHHELMITERDFVNAWEPTIATMEEPRYNHSAPAYWLLAKHAAKDTVVVLNGSGGDELFLGYPRYFTSGILERRAQRFGQLSHWAYGLKAWGTGITKWPHPLHFGDALNRWAYINTIMHRGGLEDVVGYIRNVGYPAVAQPLSDGQNAVSQYDRLFWVADEEFIRTDKIAMHVGLEGRFPFFARDVVEYAERLPSSYKLAQGLKSIPRRAYTGVLPDYIIRKQKTGWNAPVTLWMQSKFGDMVREILSREYYDDVAGLFDFDRLQGLVRRGASYTLADLKKFLPIVSFQTWARLLQIRLP